MEGVSQQDSTYINKKVASVLCALLAVCARVGYFIVTPLWIDHFQSGNTSSSQNITALPYLIVPTVLSSSTNEHPSVSVFFLMITQWSIATVTFGTLLLYILIFHPGQIGHAERTFPKRHFVIIGVSQGVSSVLFNFALSGSRTPLYLQAILSNFNIPITFIARFLILKKRPTCLKLVCASIVLLAEIICLLPTIFPRLDGNHGDGGKASGAGVYLWPLCFVLSQVPFAVANIIMERTVQAKSSSSNAANPSQLNLVFFNFWWCLFVSLTVALFFWTDVIPSFGTSNNMKEFAKNFVFDLHCIVGQAGCSAGTALLGWSNYIFSIMACLSFSGLMRYSEGASFVIIVLTLRTPILFIFWTLFKESPFGWDPEFHLSTALSIAGIHIMLPAIVIYSVGLPSFGICRRRIDDNDDNDDHVRRLIRQDELRHGQINTTEDIQ